MMIISAVLALCDVFSLYQRVYMKKIKVKSVAYIPRKLVGDSLGQS
jgi:hypothetical protein